MEMEIELDSVFNNKLKFNSNQKQDYFSSNDEETKEDTFSSITRIEIVEPKEKNISKFNFKRLLAEKKSSIIISSSEMRLKKDLEEIKKNGKIGKICEVKINDYKRVSDTDNFFMIIEFKNYFSAKFEFLPDYPFSPPIISYHSGTKMKNIFDSEGKVLLENADKAKWTPILWLSTLIISIENLISNYSKKDKNNPNFMLFDMTSKYKKRNWDEYIQTEKSYYSDLPKELDKTIKQLKSFN